MSDTFNFKNGMLPPSIAPDHCFHNTVHRWNQSDSFFVREVVTRTVCLVASSAISLISIVFHAATFLLKLPITSFRIVFGAIPIGNGRKFRDTFPTDTSFLHLMWHAYKIGFCAVDILFVPVIGFIHPRACTWVHLKMGAFFVEAPHSKQGGGSPVKPVPPKKPSKKPSKTPPKPTPAGNTPPPPPPPPPADWKPNRRPATTPDPKPTGKPNGSRPPLPNGPPSWADDITRNRRALAGYGGDDDSDGDGDVDNDWDTLDDDYDAAVANSRSTPKPTPAPVAQAAAQEAPHVITRKEQEYIDQLNRYDLSRCNENPVTNGKVAKCFWSGATLGGIVQEKVSWIEALTEGNVREADYVDCDDFLRRLSDFDAEMGRVIHVYDGDVSESEGPVVHDNSKAIAELEKYELPDVPSGIVKRNQYNGKATSMGYSDFAELKLAHEGLLERSRDGQELTREDHKLYEQHLPAFAVQFPEIIKE